MNSTASPPLASVVVRTLGRPTLSRALDSIASQTHRPVEIVLVDAAATGFKKARHGNIAVRVVSSVAALDRPKAANAGLQATRGAWISFLDEDDEIAPGHLAQLLATATVAGLPVAYSQTKVVEDGRVFGGPFNRDALMQSNYMAIHAVSFHRSLVDAGARFDESLRTFEDWDFWLQLSERTDFAFTGNATALYHATAGASGAGAGANLDKEAVLAQRNILMRKWGSKG
jgi:glycosyltransferase involved in cell wall biosynthesis